jgi:hypothetical protein
VRRGLSIVANGVLVFKVICFLGVVFFGGSFRVGRGSGVNAQERGERAGAG